MSIGDIFTTSLNSYQGRMKAIRQLMNLMQAGCPCTDNVPIAKITHWRPFEFHNQLYWQREVAVIQRSCETQSQDKGVCPLSIRVPTQK